VVPINDRSCRSHIPASIATCAKSSMPELRLVEGNVAHAYSINPHRNALHQLLQNILDNGISESDSPKDRTYPCSAREEEERYLMEIPGVELVMKRSSKCHTDQIRSEEYQGDVCGVCQVWHVSAAGLTIWRKLGCRCWLGRIVKAASQDGQSTAWNR